MESRKLTRKSLVLSMIIVGLATGVFMVEAKGETYRLFSGPYDDQMRKMQAFKSSLTHRELASSHLSPSPTPIYFAPAPAPAPVGENKVKEHQPKVYGVTLHGADPTGEKDSTEAILKAITKAINDGPFDGFLMAGISNLGGVQINLEGGNYLISQPLRLPTAGIGNLVITGGTLRASNDFPTDGYLIELSAPPNSSSPLYSYEFITLKGLMLDCNYRGGGISVIKSLRTSIDNCYIAHFSTDGIFVHEGHETYIRNSFIGQHVTAGGDPDERTFSGTAINLMGNDNAITDTVIFSASVGVMVSGQANTLFGVHCYNKATGFGGTGIYLKLPGLTQTRIINCYLDYTGIVVEDPVQLSITNSFFLGDAFIQLKSIKGVANGVNIVDNMFSGSNNGIDIIQLDQSNGPFNQIDQVVVARNIARGMNLRATVAVGSVQGNGTSWTVDFNSVLLFPNLINHVQYSVSSSGTMFPIHALRNMSNNRVVIQTNIAVTGTIFVSVDQGIAN